MAEREIIIETQEKISEDFSENASKVKTELPVNKVSAIAQGYLNNISEISDEDDEESRDALLSLMERFDDQEHRPGDADDFHNFAVALARKDEYVLACKVIEKGLEAFPKNVDLLADYLQYGTNCNMLEKCKKYYKILVKIPYRRLTWRGFAFLVDYLKFLLERSDSEKEIEAKENEMIIIVTEFRKYFPYSEETYRVEANVYKSLNMHDKELETLQKALEVLNVAPRCALRCADILFERGKYAEAASIIKRCISDATQTQSSVNEGYIYYLSALCSLADYQKSNRELTNDVVLGIYSDFNVALAKLNDSSYADVIRTKATTIVSKTGVDIPVEYDRLCECMAD